MDNVHFFSEDTSFLFQHQEITSEWILYTITTENHSLTNINYILCSDEYLHQINVEYLNHDFYTDIITFDNSEEEGIVEGDIFISIDRIEDNATQQETTFKSELRRVIIHGILHLVGFNDKTHEDKALMREKENAYLSLSKFQY